MINLRAKKGVPPYTYTLFDLSDVQLEQLSTSNEEVSFNHPHTNGFKYTITDSGGNIFSRTYDPTTATILGKYWSGPTFTHDNMVNEMENVKNEGFQMCGMMTGGDSLVDAFGSSFTPQQLWDDLGTPFDHTQPIVGSPKYKTDAVVRKAYELNLPLRISVGGYLRTFQMSQSFGYSEASLQKRPDGSNAYSTEPIVSWGIGSLTHPEFKTFLQLLFSKFVSRYAAALNSGLIMGIGLTLDTAGELQYPFHYRNSDGSDPDRHYGDFNPTMVSAFKAKYPQYNSLDNNSIAFPQYGSQLHLDWYDFHTHTLSKTIRDVIDYTIANVPTLTRTKWFVQDAGSYSDILGQWRRTYNVFDLINHPAHFIVKCNDNVQSDVDYKIDLINSMSEYIGGLSYFEPSPVSLEWERDQTRAVMNNCKNKNVSVSFFIFSWGDVVSLKNETGVTNKTTHTIRQDTIVQGGVKKIVKLTYNLSNLIVDGNSNVIASQRNNLASSNSVPQVNIEITDNVV